MSRLLFVVRPEDDRAAAFELVYKALTKRAATDPAMSEDGAQRALEELWTGPADAFRDPPTGRFDVDRLRRVAVLRARSRTTDDRRKMRHASLDAPVSTGSEETHGAQLRAPDDRLADRIDGAAALARIDRRSREAPRAVRIGLLAIRLREAGYSDQEIAAALGLSQPNLRQLICRARAWARGRDPRSCSPHGGEGWPRAG